MKKITILLTALLTLGVLTGCAQTTAPTEQYACGILPAGQIPARYEQYIDQGYYKSMEWVDNDGDGQSELKKYTFHDGAIFYFNINTETYYKDVCIVV